MCLIVFAYKMAPDIPFIFAGNRDEFYARPTETAHVWNTDPNIIAGKDKKAGGSWLGISETGKVSAITNYRDMSNIKPNAPSRGHIVKNALTSTLSTENFLTGLKSDAEAYNGFNLIAGDVKTLYYFNNQNMKIEELQPGIYSLSNALLNTSWPKSDWAKERFTEIVNSGDMSSSKLFSMLKKSETYPLKSLPETGLDNEMEKAVSAVFIQTAEYGSRSSTVMKLFNDQSFYFEERTYKAGTKKMSSKQVYTKF
jgi:uncharacterized protein with NRDE domain